MKLTQTKFWISMFIVSIIITLISMQVSATNYIPSLAQPVKQNQCAYLLQSNNGTYANLTSVTYPDGTFAFKGNSVMTKSNQVYNYTFCSTSKIGKYTYCTIDDDEGNSCATFSVNPSGMDNNLGFFIVIILLIYAIAFIGFFGKNELVTIFGGLAMIGLGLYMINNGVILFRDQITDILSWTTIGLGAFFALYASVSIVEDNL